MVKVADPYYLSAEWQSLRLLALRTAGWRCGHCGVGVRGAKAGQSRPVVDHVVPRRKGGADAISNLEVLCLPCHNRKTAHVDLNNKAPIGVDGLPDGWR